MSLKRAAASGVKWKGASFFVVEGLRFLRLFILARLLMPEDFGLMAMVTVIIGFAEIYVDGGISNAIIYRQDATRDQLASLYWLNLFAGAVVFMLVWMMTPLIVVLFAEPRLPDLIFWTALAFLIAPIGQQFRILLQKELRFKPMAQVEVAAAIAGTVTTVWSALSGHGVFSFVWGQLATVGTKSLLFTLLGWKKWRPSLHFRISDLKGYIGFGTYYMAGRVVSYFSSRVDYLIIGRFLGAEVLGAYMLAYRLVVMPLTRLNPVLNQVAFPVFARKQSDNIALQKGFLKLSRLIAFMTLPVLVGVGVMAPLLVDVLLGEKWAQAAPLIQILVVLGMVKSLVNPRGSVLLAKGRPDIWLKWLLGVAVVNTCVFWYVVQYGVVALALANVSLTIISFLLGTRFILGPLIGLGTGEYLSVFLRPTVISVGMGIVLFAAYEALRQTAVSNVAMVPILAAFTMALYGLLMIIFERQYLIENWRLFVNKKPRG